MKLIKLAVNRKAHHLLRCFRRGGATGFIKLIEGTIASIPPQGGRKTSTTRNGKIGYVQNSLYFAAVHLQD